MGNEETAERDDRPEEYRPSETQADDAEGGYSEDDTNAYLAYMLRELEVTSKAVRRANRDISILIGLVALNIIVLIIYWLDITGTINFI